MSRKPFRSPEEMKRAAHVIAIYGYFFDALIQEHSIETSHGRVPHGMSGPISNAAASMTLAYFQGAPK